MVDARPAKRARLSAELDLLERANELCAPSSYEQHRECMMALAIFEGKKPCAECQRDFNREEDLVKLRALVGITVPEDGRTALLASKKRELQEVDAEEPKTEKKLVRRCLNPECAQPADNMGPSWKICLARRIPCPNLPLR